MIRRRWTAPAALLLWLAASHGLAQSADPGTLHVSVARGEVHVEPSGATLSARELSALRSALEAQVSESPFQSGGAIQLKLRGEMVRRLQAELRSTDLDDSLAVRRAIEEVTSDFLEHSAPRRDAKEASAELVVGQEFHVAPEPASPRLIVVGSHGVVDGTLSDLTVVGSDVRIGPGGNVTGALVSVGSRVEIDPAARITGQEAAISLPATAALLSHWGRPRPEPTWQARGGAALIGWLLSLGLGLLYLRLFPRTVARSLEQLRQRPLRALGWGALHGLGVVPGALLLVVTILGILLLPLYFIAVGLAMWVGYVTSALWIGVRFVGDEKRWQGLALGLLLLQVAGLAPVFGGLLVAAMAFAGLGALALTLYRKPPRQEHAEPPAMAQPQLTSP